MLGAGRQVLRVVVGVGAPPDLVAEPCQALGQLLVMAEQASLSRGPRANVVHLGRGRGHERDLEIPAAAPRGLQTRLDPSHLAPHHIGLRRAHHYGSIGLASGQLAHPLLGHREVDRDTRVDVGAKEGDRLFDLGHLLWLQTDAVQR